MVTTTSRSGRPTAIALGVAAAIAVITFAWLGAPLVVDEWWIRKLRSSDEAEVRAAIEKIVERKMVRAAPVLLSIIGAFRTSMIEPGAIPHSSPEPKPIPALAAGALRKLDRPPEWFAWWIESDSKPEARAAIHWAGVLRWEETVPSLRRVVEKNGPLAPLAALALARILPIVRLEGSTNEKGPDGQPMRRVRLRFTNPTGRSLWFMGTSPEKPSLKDAWRGPNGEWAETFVIRRFRVGGPREFPPGSSFISEELEPESGNALRFHLNFSHSQSLIPSNFDEAVIGSWNVATVESDILEPEEP